MLYRIAVLAAMLFASSDALKIPGAMSRRSVFAKLKQASDADVYARADEGKLNSARVIQRAKEGKLVDGSSATCEELDKLIVVDKQALQFEKDKLEALGGKDKEQAKIVADVEAKIEAQVKKLEAKKGEKSCSAGFKQASDAEVYRRADEGKLNSARVIERAKEGKLVDGSSATCEELDKLIAVDKQALQFEKDKLEALGD